jgi:hypothetical protein
MALAVRAASATIAVDQTTVIRAPAWPPAPPAGTRRRGPVARQPAALALAPRGRRPAFPAPPAGRGLSARGARCRCPGATIAVDQAASINPQARVEGDRLRAGRRQGRHHVVGYRHSDPTCRNRGANLLPPGPALAVTYAPPRLRVTRAGCEADRPRGVPAKVRPTPRLLVMGLYAAPDPRARPRRPLRGPAVRVTAPPRHRNRKRRQAAAVRRPPVHAESPWGRRRAPSSPSGGACGIIPHVPCTPGRRGSTSPSGDSQRPADRRARSRSSANPRPYLEPGVLTHRWRCGPAALNSAPAPDPRGLRGARASRTVRQRHPIRSDPRNQ